MSKPNNSLPALDERQRYTIPEACSLLRTSRATIYKLIGAHQLRVIKEGARTFIPGSEIVRRSQVPA